MFRTKRRYIFILLLGIYSFLNVKFTEGDALINIPLADFLLYLIIQAIVVCIWEGNHLLEKLANRKRLQKIALQLVQQFGLSLIIVSLVSLISSFSIQFITGSPATTISIKLLLGFSFRINLFLHCINAIITYNHELGRSKLEAIRLKKETSEAKFEALRKQINPHFLFNSFNVLSSLIESNTKLAVEFVEQLSIAYRYLLKTENLKVVSLTEELAFLEAYLFLLQIRFQNNLKVDLEIVKNESLYLPPSTLQMLIENAIKHNEVSKRSPLKIDLQQQNGSLIVINNLNPKTRSESSSMIGLNNIKNRYSLLGEKAPVIEKTDDQFIVTIPLIKEP